MSQTNLCQLPPEPPSGCCQAPPAPSAVPLTIANSPGLAAISCRIGTFTSFRRAMLDEVARADLLGTTPNPFAAWSQGTDGDYQTIFIELWAYLADILTFYQERIANEAYIGTATQRDSLLRLVQLIDYHPSPGAGTSGIVAFTVANGKVAEVPAGFRLGSRAQAGKPAAVFETSAALTARGEHSAIALSAVAPTNQFAQLSSFGAIFGSLGSLSVALAEDLYGSAGNTYIKTLPTRGAASAALQFSVAGTTETETTTSMTALSSALASSARIAERSPVLGNIISNAGNFSHLHVGYLPFLDLTTRTVVLQGVNNKLAVGDYVLTVENEHSANENSVLHQVSSASVDKAGNTTSITWKESSRTTYDQSSSPVTLYAMRVKAGAFGNTAPKWLTLPATLTNSDGQHGGANPPPPFPPAYPDNWDDPNSPEYYLPQGNVIALDATYDEARASVDNPGWVALLSGDRSRTSVIRFVEVGSVALTSYALNTKVTQLTLAAGVSIPGSTFGIRDTAVLVGAEPLALQNNLPLPDPLQGNTLILAGLYPDLQDSQAVVVEGNLFDSTSSLSAPVSEAEFAVLDGPPLLDRNNNLTTVVLKKPLANRYVRATTTMLANVVAITQGETVKDEVLGSGDASAYQTYALKKKPLTYLPSTDPEGSSALQSTLIVTVNGLKWEEQPTLLESGPDTQAFTTMLDDSGQTTVLFGDGVNGARPSTGTGNIHARYRNGLGSSGNVSAGGIQQLIDNLAGLQRVTNPQSTSGGTDPDSPGQIRVNAPASVRTFNRAVSAEDYAALALSFPGIAKASATWVVRDANLGSLAQPYVQLTVATIDQTPIKGTPLAGQLRNFLDSRRDSNIPLRILDFTPVYIDIAVTVDLDDQYGRRATFAAVQAALNPGLNADGSAGYFAFQKLDFGENLHLSAVYAALQNVPGVRDANITTFRRMDLDAANPSVVRTDIFIGPTEIAVIGNDLAHPEHGLLTIDQGSGGFVDA